VTAGAALAAAFGLRGVDFAGVFGFGLAFGLVSGSASSSKAGEPFEELEGVGSCSFLGVLTLAFDSGSWMSLLDVAPRMASLRHTVFLGGMIGFANVCDLFVDVEAWVPEMRRWDKEQKKKEVRLRIGKRRG